MNLKLRVRLFCVYVKERGEGSVCVSMCVCERECMNVSERKCVFKRNRERRKVCMWKRERVCVCINVEKSKNKMNLKVRKLTH